MDLGISSASQQSNVRSDGQGRSSGNEFADAPDDLALSSPGSNSHPNLHNEALRAELTSTEALAAEPTTAERLLGEVKGNAVNDEAVATTVLDNGIAAAQGTTGLLAREGIGSEAARNSYNQQAAALDPADKIGRTELKASTRADTPPVTRAVINSIRPDLGPKLGTSGNATHTNVGANQLADTLGKVGRGAAVVGAVIGVTRIANAENKVEEAALVGGGVLGGIGAGALAGAQLGAMGANPLTIGVGALAGAVLGGIAGEAAVSSAIGWAKSWF